MPGRRKNADQQNNNRIRHRSSAGKESKGRRKKRFFSGKSKERRRRTAYAEDNGKRREKKSSRKDSEKRRKKWFSRRDVERERVKAGNYRRDAGNPRKDQRDRARRKRRRLYALRRWVIFLVIASIVCAGGYLLKTKIDDGFFTIRYISVYGNEAVDSKTVRDICSDAVGQNIITVNINELYREIDENLFTESVMITKKYPDTLVVTVKESPILCAVVEGDSVYYLNDDLKVVEKSDYLMKTNVPVLSGVSGVKDAKMMETVTLSPDEKSQTAIEILKTFQTDGYLSDISEINCSSEGDYRIITKRNLFIIVKDKDNFDNQYDYIKLILDEGQSDMNVNLTTDKYPIVKSRK